MEKIVKYYNLSNFDESQDLWYELQKKENIVDKIWKDIPFSFIEKWFSITSKKIALNNRNDKYSQTIDEICKSCIKNEKVSIKQFKCVLLYASNIVRTKNLNYKYKS
jgi:hypothetical protein